MPRIPKWLGDTMESVFSRMMIPVIVTDIDYPFPDLKRIIVEGDFYKTKFAPGNAIEFRVTDTDFRHYTVSSWDKETGVCEMLVYLHGRGAGSKWMKDIRGGEALKLMGPGGRIKYRENCTKHFIFGDETSVGLMECIVKEALRLGHEYYCVAELDSAHYQWAEYFNFLITVTGKEYEPAAKEAVERILAMDASFWEDWSNATFYLTGRAKSIQAVRSALIQQGIAMKNISTEPYWAEGKKGL